MSGADFKLMATDGTNNYGLKVGAKQSYGIAARAGVRPTEGTGIYAPRRAGQHPLQGKSERRHRLGV